MWFILSAPLGGDFSPSDKVISQYYGVTVSESGPGFDMGLYTINPDNSLILRDVSNDDEGRYYCLVADDGGLYRGFADVTIKSEILYRVAQKERNTYDQ